MIISCYSPEITAEDGTFIFLLRDRLGWTQARFAEHIGVSTILVSMVETGQKEVSKKILEKIAKKMHVTIEVKFLP